MIVAPGRWYKNRSTDKVCACVRVAAPWIFVRYQSGVETRYHRDQFIRGFEMCMTPARVAGKRD